MAKKSSYTEFREIASEIRKNKFSPVYLLMGEEDYYIDELVKMLEAKVVPEEEKDFNSLTFYGAETEISTVIASCQQFPVMPGFQIVLLKEAQALWNAKSQLDKLASYVAKPNPTTVLVITYKGDSLTAAARLVKNTLASGGTVFKSEKLRDYQLSGPVTDYCSTRGKRIDEKALTLICDYCGTSLSKLFGEIDKLLLAMDVKSSTITCDDIEKNIGISKDFNTFELVKAMARKDYPRSMMIVEYFSRNPKQNPGVMIVSTLFNFYSKLFLATILKDKSDASLMAELDLKNSFALNDYRNALRCYNSRMAWGAVHAIRQHDAKTKGIGSTWNEYDLLKELIYIIFTVS